jgi:hypothetical protein
MFGYVCLKVWPGAEGAARKQVDFWALLSEHQGVFARGITASDDSDDLIHKVFAITRRRITDTPAPKPIFVRQSKPPIRNAGAQNDGTRAVAPLMRCDTAVGEIKVGYRFLQAWLQVQGHKLFIQCISEFDTIAVNAAGIIGDAIMKPSQLAAALVFVIEPAKGKLKAFAP